MTHPDTLTIHRAVVEQALKKHETNCCMFERGVQTLDDVLASRATFLAALQPQDTQAALTAALEALKTAQEALPPYGAIRRELDAAIAQIGALGVKHGGI